ncbi:MAG: hypothetical protein ACREUV_03185 [Burkholderiales bacterium]
MEAGDGAKITDEKTITLSVLEECELLLFDLD